MQVYKNILYFRCRLHYNIGKIIHKNVNNISYIQNFVIFSWPQKLGQLSDLE